MCTYQEAALQVGDGQETMSHAFAGLMLLWVLQTRCCFPRFRGGNPDVLLSTSTSGLG